MKSRGADGAGFGSRNVPFLSSFYELRIKASQRVGVLSRLRNLIPMEAKLLLYKSSILPYLTYCHLIWHFCKASDARKVERVQDRALRIVYSTHSVEYSNLLNRANLSSLQNRRLQDLATSRYKVKYGSVPSNVVDIFSVKSSKYHLRNMDFHLPRFNSVSYGKHSIRYSDQLDHIYGLDWTAKSRINLLYNPSRLAYGILTLWICLICSTWEFLKIFVYFSGYNSVIF